MMKKRPIILTLIFLFCITLAACGDPTITSNIVDEDHYGDPDQTWAIYWYLCGSDLESEYGAATDDLSEMMDVSLPENVKIVIQTGGAWSWANDLIDSEQIERYVYDSEGLECVDQQPLANMGDANTLADFLNFCKTDYPADRTMVLFWDHGGGSVAGAVFDELYDYDSLTLDEFHAAFDSVYDLSSDEPPIDLIGFDACLMATIDTAHTFSDISHYMVASEEWESGIGWLYSGWLQALADDPRFDGALLGREICDSFMDGCIEYGVDFDMTLSVTDLSRVPSLVEAYDAMGSEALSYALDDPAFLSDFAFEAEYAENYGGNTRSEGYSNLVDLGHLAENCCDILPHSYQNVIDCLQDCVIYNVTGPFHSYATGLSCYHSYNNDFDDFYGYSQVGCSDSFKYLYNYQLSGELPPEGITYIADLGYEADDVSEIPDLTDDSDAEYPLYIDDEDYVVLELDPETLNMLKSISFQLAYIDEEEDIMLLLGQDNDIDMDWDNGIFRDNFRGMWGAIDGYLVSMEIAYEGDDYTTYSVPILLNGEDYNLRVSYVYEDEQFYILGARKALDDNGIADKNLTQLMPGDEITTIHYASTISGDDDFIPVPVDTFTVTEDTSFAETDMGDGTFLMMFELQDARNNLAYSEMIQFTVDGDYMDIEILDE